MKHILISISLLLATMSAHANYNIGVGAQLGSDNAMSVGYQNWDLGVKFDRFQLTLDHRFDSTLLEGLYFGAGAMVSNKDDEYFGLRGKAGFGVKSQNVEFFAEVVPNITFGARGGFNFDYGIGARYWF